MALEEACQAAGGEQYVVYATYSCSATVDGSDGSSEITLTGGLINDPYCYAAICTLADVEADSEDYHIQFIPADVDQTVFNCTGETSVEAGGAQPNLIAPSPTASSPTSSSLTAPSPSVNAPTGGPPPPSPMAPESSDASVPKIQLWSVMLVAGVMGVFGAL